MNFKELKQQILSNPQVISIKENLWKNMLQNEAKEFK
jgi:hypothetical protein